MKLKSKISANFSRASRSYDDNASMQLQIAKNLVHIAKHHIKNNDMMLDIGSGTGFVAKELGKKIIQADIAFDMCRAAAPLSPVICADIENLPFPKKHFDAVFSSSALQWLNHERAIGEVWGILKRNGVFAFSIFGPGTLAELKQAYIDIKVPVSINDFADEDDLRLVIDSAGLEIIRFRKENIKLDFASVKDLLQYMKNIGAGASISNISKLTKTALNKLEEKFPNGISSTWEVFYFIAAKR